MSGHFLWVWEVYFGWVDIFHERVMVYFGWADIFYGRVKVYLGWVGVDGGIFCVGGDGGGRAIFRMGWGGWRWVNIFYGWVWLSGSGHSF